MISLFKKQAPSVAPLSIDIHSHLLPGIDDGVKDLEQSIFVIKQLYELGYRKFITTPHVMSDFFPNTPSIIRKKLEEVQAELKFLEIPVQIEAAAEYYLDDYLVQMLDEEKEILTFGDGYFLFETSFINEPAYLMEVVFKLNAMGLKPVLAHPERYLYLHNDADLVNELLEKGVLFQINIMSLSGYYSSESKRFAEKLIDLDLVSFVGSDCHGMKHVDAITKTSTQKYFKKALNLKLLNYSL